MINLEKVKEKRATPLTSLLPGRYLKFTPRPPLEKRGGGGGGPNYVYMLVMKEPVMQVIITLARDCLRISLLILANLSELIHSYSSC